MPHVLWICKFVPYVVQAAMMLPIHQNYQTFDQLLLEELTTGSYFTLLYIPAIVPLAEGWDISTM